MTGWLTLQTWDEKTTITDVTAVRRDGRDLLVDGATGTKRIPGSHFGRWQFIRKTDDGSYELDGGPGYAHCDE